MGMYLMRHRPRRLPERPAGLHGVSRLEKPAVVLAGHRASGLGAVWWWVPGLLALVFGSLPFAHQGRVLFHHHQALTYAAMLLFFRNETGFGGNNGFTDFKRILGYGIAAPGTRATLFLLTVLLLVAALAAGSGWSAASSAACSPPFAMPSRG
jgi:ABC-type branched-subunit amino acid transport system permease subunit